METTCSTTNQLLAILNHRYIYSYDESNIQLLINNITQNNKIKISKIDLNINEFLSLVFFSQTTK